MSKNLNIRLKTQKNIINLCHFCSKTLNPDSTVVLLVMVCHVVTCWLTLKHSSTTQFKTHTQAHTTVDLDKAELRGGWEEDS